MDETDLRESHVFAAANDKDCEGFSTIGCG